MKVLLHLGKTPVIDRHATWTWNCCSYSFFNMSSYHITFHFFMTLWSQLLVCKSFRGNKKRLRFMRSMLISRDITGKMILRQRSLVNNNFCEMCRGWSPNALFWSNNLSMKQAKHMEPTRISDVSRSFQTGGTNPKVGGVPKDYLTKLKTAWKLKKLDQGEGGP